MFTKKSMIISAIIFLVLAALSAFGGTFFAVRYFKKQKLFVETTATVVSFEPRVGTWAGHKFDPDEEYVAIVEYVVNGKTYQEKLGDYSYPPKYRWGQSILIKYNPNNPKEIIDRFNFKFVWFYVVSAIFVAAGVGLFIGVAKKKKVKEITT